MRILLPELLALLDGLTVGGVAVAADLVPHDQWLPLGGALPFVGLRNGGANWEDMACQVSEGACLVNLVASVRMDDEDNASALAGATGTWAILDAATAALFAGADTCTGIEGWSLAKDHPDTIIKTDNGQWIVQSLRSLLFTVQRPTL